MPKSSVKPQISAAAAAEAKALSSAREATTSTVEAMSISFRKQIAEVRCIRSKYSDGCYASIRFKDNKCATYGLDYDCQAEPGDTLSISSLKWKTIQKSDGSTITVLSGKVQ